MGQPEVLRPAGGEIRRSADALVSLHEIEVMDGGFFRISLRIGSKSHRVALEYLLMGRQRYSGTGSSDFASSA